MIGSNGGCAFHIKILRGIIRSLAFAVSSARHPTTKLWTNRSCNYLSRNSSSILTRPHQLPYLYMFGTKDTSETTGCTVPHMHMHMLTCPISRASTFGTLAHQFIEVWRQQHAQHLWSALCVAGLITKAYSVQRCCPCAGGCSVI